MMKAIEVALGGHEGTHRLGFAHMPNNGIYAPPAGAFNTSVSMVFLFCLVARQSALNGQLRSDGVGLERGMCLEQNPSCPLCGVTKFCDYHAQPKGKTGQFPSPKGRHHSTGGSEFGGSATASLKE